MIGFYNYTVILTYISTICGFAGIVSIWNGDMRNALICLMIAGLCDMFDGRIASLKQRSEQEKRFGIQIDSMSDLICFGVLPALIILNYIEGTAFRYIAAAVFLLCALIRLAWFNVDEEIRQENEADRRKFYLGLPVTSCAIIIPLSISLFYMAGITSEFFLLGVFIAVAAAFLMPFRIKKPDFTGNFIILLIGIVSLCAVLITV